METLVKLDETNSIKTAYFQTELKIKIEKKSFKNKIKYISLLFNM